MVGMTTPAAILAIVVDRMIVTGRGLKGEELRFRDCSRGNVEDLAQIEILEITRGTEAVVRWIKSRVHVGSRNPPSYPAATVLAARRWCAMSHSAAPVTTAISGNAARFMKNQPAFAARTPDKAAAVAVAA